VFWRLDAGRIAGWLWRFLQADVQIDCTVNHKPRNSPCTEKLLSVAWGACAECFYSVRHNCLLVVNKLSETFSVRIPRELKEKIEATPADWSQEVRNFLTERVKQKELLKILQEIDAQPQRRKTKIDSTTLIREDRERQE
jgi:hypothetical protein